MVLQAEVQPLWKCHFITERVLLLRCCCCMQGANITNTDWTDVVLRKDQQVTRWPGVIANAS
jgi:hypothetical protein